MAAIRNATTACRPRSVARFAGRCALAGATWIFLAAIAMAQDTANVRAAELRAAIGGDRPLLVVASGNDPADAVQFERWLERPVDGVQLHNGREDWADWIGSIGWLIDVWDGQARPVFWSIQLLPRNGASLVEGAAGRYDAHYAEAARLLADGQAQGPIFVRIGWEFNGNWMPWAAAGQEQAFVATYRNLVTQFRLVSDRFVFEWSPNVGDHGMDPGRAWPGDDVVDIVGIDFYYQPKWNSPDPRAAWDEMVSQPYGLAWHRNFAAAHGKPRAFSEWGVALDTSGPYVRHAAAWFDQNDVVYHSYWNSDADFAGKLSDGRMPSAGAAFKAVFGQ